MSNLGFKNIREPIVYVLDQELRKKNLKNKLQIDSGDGWNGELVEYPVQLIRDDKKKVIKCIYGVGSQQWSEEIIRNDSGKVISVKMTYPDGSIETVHIHRSDENLIDFLSKT